MRADAAASAFLLQLECTRPCSPPMLAARARSWKTGQDQARVIKQLLREVLPGIRVFLDVDDLNDISQLEAEIASSQAVLVFVSQGYFESVNCLRELMRAMELEDEGGLSPEDRSEELADRCELFFVCESEFADRAFARTARARRPCHPRQQSPPALQAPPSPPCHTHTAVTPTISLHPAVLSGWKCCAGRLLRTCPALDALGRRVTDTLYRLRRPHGR